MKKLLITCFLLGSFAYGQTPKLVVGDQTYNLVSGDLLTISNAYLQGVDSHTPSGDYDAFIADGWVPGTLDFATYTANTYTKEVNGQRYHVWYVGFRRSFVIYGDTSGTSFPGPRLEHSAPGTDKCTPYYTSQLLLQRITIQWINNQ